MSSKSRQELVKRLRPRYLKAKRSEKTKILDEFVSVTGLHRKSAIRALRTQEPAVQRERRGRRKKYTGSMVSALVTIWRVCGTICGKRLKPFMPEMVKILERHGELTIDAQTRDLLVTVSAATIDRLLHSFRTGSGRGKSTTKPGGLLKHQIAVRTFADWDDTKAGFVEIDLVAHCAESVEGQFLYTFTATDVKTGWTECIVIPRRSQEAVAAALDQLQARLPFPLLGIDSDNGSEFINGTILRYCKQHEITFTRCRPYKKNDQCYVEQKNWSIVRRTVGYGRYESAVAQQVMEEIYADLRWYTNMFQPTFKLKRKERTGAKVYREYEVPQTPYQRVVAQKLLSAEDALQWSEEYNRLNPAELRRRIDKNIKRLWMLRK